MAGSTTAIDIRLLHEMHTRKACARLCAIRDRKQFKTRNFLFI